ncbi:Tcr1 transposon ORF2 [Micractinium conductrix]|uniref:Tcr1 transposon ORF2 n=1 Tax=Micractinium conductrix TaxID=554055 RepID=A0A2P6VRZ0_9CHLO|nr:Tcr1 transposon ORF2 [Micractinium conductrix]|eukprot:PSC76837.1 Tcr1 transposon ORF2 [Micractinium conductrix]
MCALLYLVHLGVQYDVTAVGSTMCRHNVVAHLMDIATGERYIYASVLLYVLMVTCHIPVLFVWYDINCRFSAYFRQWACKHPMLASLLVYVGTKFVLPIFHRYSHSAACQQKNDALYHVGAGRQYIEPNETFWAYIGPHGATTQYMTLRNRQGRLERAGQLYNWRQARRIVTLLCDMTAKAVRVRDAADSQLSDLLGELEATHGYHTPQAVKLMLEPRIRSLERALFNGEKPSLVQLMEHLITRLTSRPGELAKVRKSKQQLKARMEPVLASLMSWRAGGYVGFDRLPRELRQLAPTIDAARGWAVGKLHA